MGIAAGMSDQNPDSDATHKHIRREAELYGILMQLVSSVRRRPFGPVTVAPIDRDLIPPLIEFSSKQSKQSEVIGALVADAMKRINNLFLSGEDDRKGGA